MQHAQPMQWFIYMYHRFFICTMYDSYGLELCIMYDSHGVYLRVLWTICMYKFSRCHVVVFHSFFVPFTEFRQKPPRTRHAGFQKKRLIYRSNWPIYR
jgi:hypothetical protein